MGDEYHVESILAHMTYAKAYSIRKKLGFNPDDKFEREHSKYVYKVKWEGYDEITWEPESNLIDNIELSRYKSRKALPDDHLTLVMKQPFSWLDEDVPNTSLLDDDLFDDGVNPLTGKNLVHDSLSGKKKDAKRKRSKHFEGDDSSLEAKRLKKKSAEDYDSDIPENLKTPTTESKSTPSKKKTVNISTPTNKKEDATRVDVSTSAISDSKKNKIRKKSSSNRCKTLSPSKFKEIQKPVTTDDINVRTNPKSKSPLRKSLVYDQYELITTQNAGEGLKLCIKKISPKSSRAPEPEKEPAIPPEPLKVVEENASTDADMEAADVTVMTDDIPCDSSQVETPVKQKEKAKEVTRSKEKAPISLQSSKSPQNSEIIVLDDSPLKSSEKKSKDKAISQKTSGLVLSKISKITGKTLAAAGNLPKKEKTAHSSSLPVPPQTGTPADLNSSKSKPSSTEKWKKPKGTKLLAFEEALGLNETPASAPLSNKEKERLERLNNKLKESEEKLKSKKISKEKSFDEIKKNLGKEETIPLRRYAVDMLRVTKRQAMVHLHKTRRCRSLERLNDRWSQAVADEEETQEVEAWAKTVAKLIVFIKNHSPYNKNPLYMNVFMRRSKKDYNKWKICDPELKRVLRQCTIATTIVEKVETAPHAPHIPRFNSKQNSLEENSAEQLTDEQRREHIEHEKQILLLLAKLGYNLNVGEIDGLNKLIRAYALLQAGAVKTQLILFKNVYLRFLIISKICELVPLCENQSDYGMDKVNQLLFSDETRSKMNSSLNICSANHAKCGVMEKLMEQIPPKWRFLRRQSPFYLDNFFKCMKNGAHCQKLVFLVGGVPLGLCYQPLEKTGKYFGDQMHLAILQQNPRYLIDFIRLGMDVNVFGAVLEDPSNDSSLRGMPIIEFFSKFEELEMAGKESSAADSYLSRLRTLFVPLAVRLEAFCQNQTRNFFSEQGMVVNYKGPLTPAHIFRSIAFGDIAIMTSLTYKNVSYVDHEIQFPTNIISLSAIPKGAIKEGKCVVILTVNHINIVGGKKSETDEYIINPLCVSKRVDSSNKILTARILLRNKTEINMELVHEGTALSIFKMRPDFEDDLNLDLIQMIFKVEGPSNNLFAAQLQLLHVV